MPVSDVIHPYSGTYEFSPFSREHVILFPAENRDLLREVTLRFHCSPTAPTALSVDDMRLYLDATDVTQAVVHLLQDSLRASSQSVKTQYGAALDKWLLLERVLAGGGYPGGVETQTAAALKALAPEDTFKQLGAYLQTPTFGHGGNLHLINFLFTEVALPRLSLSQIISTHNASTGGSLKLANVKTMTFSNGPCRLYEDQWNPPVQPMGGAVTYYVDYTYVNPLDAPVHDILDTVGPHGIIQAKILEIEDKLNQANQTLTDIDDNVGVTSVLQTDTLPTLAQKLTGISARVETCNQNLGDSHNLEALKSSKDELTHNLGQ